jgi:hypothetical protein
MTAEQAREEQERYDKAMLAAKHDLEYAVAKENAAIKDLAFARDTTRVMRRRYEEKLLQAQAKAAECIRAGYLDIRRD